MGSCSVIRFYSRCLLALLIVGCVGSGSVSPRHAMGADDVTESGRQAVEQLRMWLGQPAANRGMLADQPFATVALMREQSEQAAELLWAERAGRLRSERAAEVEAKVLRDGELEMPFDVRVFGEKPEHGRRLFISLHGGGGAPKQVNDQQWNNQKRLYTPEEGVYVAPRAPTDTWNLWHQGHIDRLFDRLIQDMVLFHDVDPDRVYVMGYSAGGDGVYQLAPRMADRWAAAAMMAGHPNETSPLGLRNIAFTMHVGGQDSAYNRNQVARDWSQKLAELHQADPGGYVHWAKIYEDKSHWLDREDAAAVPWMSKHARRVFPNRVVWKQDDVTHARFYWLAVDDENRRGGTEIVASVEGQRIELEAKGVSRVTVRLHDELLDLQQPLAIAGQGAELFAGTVQRTIKTLHSTLEERGDPRLVFPAEVVVTLPAAPAAAE